MSNNLKVPDTAITPFITQLHIGSSRSSTLLVIPNRSVKEMPLQLLLRKGNSYTAQARVMVKKYNGPRKAQRIQKNEDHNDLFKESKV